MIDELELKVGAVEKVFETAFKVSCPIKCKKKENVATVEEPILSEKVGRLLDLLDGIFW